MHLQPNLVRDGVKIESTDLVEIVNIIFTKLQKNRTESLEQNIDIERGTVSERTKLALSGEKNYFERSEQILLRNTAGVSIVCFMIKPQA